MLRLGIKGLTLKALTVTKMEFLFRSYIYFFKHSSDENKESDRQG